MRPLLISADRLEDSVLAEPRRGRMTSNVSYWLHLALRAGANDFRFALELEHRQRVIAGHLKARRVFVPAAAVLYGDS